MDFVNLASVLKEALCVSPFGGKCAFFKLLGQLRVGSKGEPKRDLPG